MTATAATDLLSLLDTDPAVGIGAAADLRERRARDVQVEHPGSWLTMGARPTREHIAAEANPDHALAEVALWRGIVERHTPSYCCTPAKQAEQGEDCPWPVVCRGDDADWPCPDLLAVAAAVRAYLGGAA